MKCEQEEAADHASCQICISRLQRTRGYTHAELEAEFQACRAPGSYVELGSDLSHKTQSQVSATDFSRTPPEDGARFPRRFHLA